MTAAYAIERGVPIPPPRAGSSPGRRPRTELSRAVSAMEPGDSILLTEHGDWQRMRSLWHVFGPEHLTSRKTREGWRIWRTA